MKYQQQQQQPSTHPQEECKKGKIIKGIRYQRIKMAKDSTIKPEGMMACRNPKGFTFLIYIPESGSVPTLAESELLPRFDTW